MRSLGWQSVNKAGILSLSAKPDHGLMWAHYSSSHTGICLRFRRAPWSWPFRAAQRVLYSDERPIVNPITDDADAVVDKSVLTKSTIWSYEQEWRIIDHENAPGLRTFMPEALDGIILGARIDPAVAAEVASWTRGRAQAVELLQARPHETRFQIDIVPVPIRDLPRG